MPWPRFRPRSLRIREKLILLFVFVAALTLGLAGLLITQAARRTLEARIATENEALVRAVSALVEVRAGQAIRNLRDAALARDIRGALEARDIPRLEARLKRVRDHFDLFDSVWILDPEGIVLANSPPVIALRGQSFTSREYYKEVVSSREPILSPGFRRSAPPHSVISAAAVPVTDRTGHLLGVLVAALDLSRLESQIRLAMGAGPYRIVLLDRTGRALIHPEPANLLQFPPPEGPGDARELSSRVFLRDVGWTLSVSQPGAVAFAPLAQIEVAILWALLVGVIGAVALASVVATRFIRPLEALRREVQALAPEEAGEQANGGDELAALRREFDRMRASIAEQAQIVEARTGALEALLEIASTVNASLDLDSVLGQALERTLAITGADLGGIRLYDAGRGVLESLCTRGEWQAADRIPPIQRPGEGLSGRAAETRMPIFLSGDAADLGLLATTEGARAAAAIPLLARERLQGSLVFLYRHPHVFTDQEQQLLAGIGNEIGTAIENARLFQETRGQAAALQTLALVNQQVTSSLEPAQVSKLVCNAALALLRAAYARIWLLEPDGRHLGLGATATVGEGPARTSTRLPLDGSLVGWVVREQQIRYSPRLAEDPLQRHTDWVRAGGYVSQIAAPLLHGEKALGALVVLTREFRQFSEFERDLLSSLAAQAAIALENARLHAAAVRRGEELAALLRATQTVMAGLDLNATLERIVEEASRIAGTPHVNVLLVDREAQVIRLGAGVGRSAAMFEGLRHPLGAGFSGVVAATSQPLFVADTLSDPRNLLTERNREFGIVTYLGLPIKVRQEVVGVLTFNTTQPQEYSADELAYLASFADQAAVAIENARLFALSQRRLERAQALYETGRAVSGTLDLAQLFDLIIAKTAEHLRVRKCALWRVEVQGNEMTIAYQAGRGLSPTFSAAVRQAVGEGTTGNAIELRRPVWSADILNDPAMWLGPPLRARIEAEGYRAVLSAPILAQGEPIGALVIYRDEAGPFDREEVEFLQALAHQAGAAIYNAQLFAGLRGQTDRLESLIRVSRLIGSSLELEHVLAAIVCTCTELLEMDAATLWTLNEQEGVLENQVDHGLAEARSRARHRLEPGAGFIGQALADRRVLVSANFAEDPRVENQEWAKREGLVAAAGVPLLIGDKAIGTLAVFKRSPWTFSESDITLLSSFASQAAIAIQNARLFAELKEHSEHLEERVRARTAELEEANRAKSQFLATMSHELRTPLNAIIGFSALLEEKLHGPLTEKQARYVTNIYKSGKHLLAVINDILDLTKVEAGKLELTLHPVDLGGAIQDSLTLVHGMATDKRLSLGTEVPEGLPPAVADPVRLKQILYNLLSNAVKFTPEGGAVTVGVEMGEEAFAIWVRDTGIGIAPEDQERIFREFEQVDSSLARHYQGTGLGLALTRKLVKLHGGRIWMESTLGKGTTFTFTLPRRNPDVVPAVQA